MIKLTPDLLTFNDGSPVDASTWLRRREELAAAIIPHEYGGTPPVPARMNLLRRSLNRIRAWSGVLYEVFEIRVIFEHGRELSLTLSLWTPPGDGPFPVVLNADGCWRNMNDDVVQRILDRGNIAASLDRTDAAADNRDCYRETGLYRVFPDAEFSVLAAWAWACHRAVDALERIDRVRADAIALCGHSRGGKTALLAGATDERIALTNPNNSGIGGAGLHRLKMPGSETVDSFTGGNIFWFGQKFAEYRMRDGELPYDQHFLHALVAPRPLLLTEAYEDHAANPPGTYAAALAAQKVYGLLERGDAIGWSMREGAHAHTPADFDALLDFMDRHLHGRELRRDFQRKLYPDIEELLQQPCAENARKSGKRGKLSATA